MNLYLEAKDIFARLVDLRHELHRNPEVGLHLPATQSRVVKSLEGLPLQIVLGKSLSSVTAVLHGSHPGPTVLLRGDMDGLPLHETSGEPFTSEIDGNMHACGHDIHTAGLVGAAELLSQHRDDLHGSVIFMFQPGEEGHDGAAQMLAEGCADLTGELPVAAYAVHMEAAAPVGSVLTRTGTVFLAGTGITVAIKGRGGHGGRPHLTLDPIPAMTAILSGLQQVAAHASDPFQSFVLSVGKVQAGTAPNIIADSAEISMSLRSVSDATHQTVIERIRRLCTNTAIAFGVEAEIRIDVNFPATVNAANEVERAERVVAGMFGTEAWTPMETPFTGSDDFGHVLAKIPGVYMMLGARPSEIKSDDTVQMHSPNVRFDDEVLPVAAGLLAALTLDRLADPQQIS